MKHGAKRFCAFSKEAIRTVCPFESQQLKKKLYSYWLMATQHFNLNFHLYFLFPSSLFSMMSLSESTRMLFLHAQQMTFSSDLWKLGKMTEKWHVRIHSLLRNLLLLFVTRLKMKKVNVCSCNKGLICKWEAQIELKLQEDIKVQKAKCSKPGPGLRRLHVFFKILSWNKKRTYKGRWCRLREQPAWVNKRAI